MNKNINSREIEIEKYLKSGKFVTTKELAGVLGVSITTIQRDLIRMEKENIIERKHGGVILSNKLSQYPDLINRTIKNMDSKNRIALKAVGLLKENDFIFIETGSTCMSFYEKIDVPNITVFTNSLMVAMQKNTNCELYVVEGYVHNDNYGIYGNLAIESLDKIKPNKIFFSCVGVDLNGKILSFREYDRSIINKICTMSGEKILLMDSTKFGVPGAFTAASLDAIDVVITDKNISEEYKKIIERENVKLYIV